MAYPLDGTPNLRPGAEQDPNALARRYDPALDLDALFEDFLADSASIINDRTERLYRYDFGYFRGWLDETDLPAILGSISKENLVAYIAWLQRRPKQKGKGTLSSHSVHHYTRVIRTFVRWLGRDRGGPLCLPTTPSTRRDEQPERLSSVRSCREDRVDNCDKYDKFRP